MHGLGFWKECQDLKELPAANAIERSPMQIEVTDSV